MFRRAGLGDVELAVYSVEYAQPDYMRVMFVEERLVALVAAGEVAASEANAFRAELEERHRTGTFFGNAIGYAIVGTKL
jgi:hypothetical protein